MHYREVAMLSARKDLVHYAKAYIVSRAHLAGRVGSAELELVKAILRFVWLYIVEGPMHDLTMDDDEMQLAKLLSTQVETFEKPDGALQDLLRAGAVAYTCYSDYLEET